MNKSLVGHAIDVLDRTFHYPIPNHVVFHFPIRNHECFIEPVD